MGRIGATQGLNRAGDQGTGPHAGGGLSYSERGAREGPLYSGGPAGGGAPYPYSERGAREGAHYLESPAREGPPYSGGPAGDPGGPTGEGAPYLGSPASDDWFDGEGPPYSGGPAGQGGPYLGSPTSDDWFDGLELCLAEEVVPFDPQSLSPTSPRIDPAPKIDPAPEIDRGPKIDPGPTGSQRRLGVGSMAVASLARAGTRSGATQVEQDTGGTQKATDTGGEGRKRPDIGGEGRRGEDVGGGRRPDTGGGRRPDTGGGLAARRAQSAQQTRTPAVGAGAYVIDVSIYQTISFFLSIYLSV